MKSSTSSSGIEIPNSIKSCLKLSIEAVLSQSIALSAPTNFSASSEPISFVIVLIEL